MRAALSTVCFFLVSSAAVGQAPGTAAFEIASVKPSQRQIGADYNNQVTLAPSRITARNVTLRRLVCEVYGLQVRQVLGPNWLDQNEYDIEARTDAQANREQLDLVLRALLIERFNLRQHRETRVMQVYELRIEEAGAKVHPTYSGGPPRPGAGLHFHGEMRQFADFLAVQLSIPMASDSRPLLRRVS